MGPSKQQTVSMGIDSIRDIHKIMMYCQLTIVGSVEPNAPESRARLDKLEANIENRVVTNGSSETVAFISVSSIGGWGAGTWTVSPVYIFFFIV